MTGYHLQVGYQSGNSKADAWEALKAIVADLRTRPNELAVECARYDDFSKADLMEYAELYQGDRDATISIIEADGDREAEVMQLASGMGASRDIKEALRRAFCRLVICRMHERGMEVNLVVA